MKYFFALACTLLLFNSAFCQIILIQTQNDATIGLDRKAFNGLGNTSQSSDGYAHDFTLPESTSSCQRISGISVAINLTGYTNNSLPGCPPITLYYNLFYGCGTYSGGATCLPASNLIAEPNFAPNTSPPPFNFGNPLGSPLNATIVPDFGDNLSVDIIPVSNPGCNSVSNGRISYQYTITVTVSVEDVPDVSPTFTQVPAICEGDTLSDLPTTSSNGITGTWSPAPDNTVTTTYTFTPNSDPCATTQTMTITVNPADIEPTFTQVPAICEGGALSALPTTSNNSITGTWSPVINNTTTSEYTFTPNADQCATTQTMIITVNAATTPIFTQVQDICEGESLAALPTTSNNGIEGSWSPVINNTVTTEYTFTPNADQCATAQTMIITVNAATTPIFTQVPAICEGESLAALPVTSNNGITGTWSPTVNNTTTTEYLFTPDAGQCAITQTMIITVNPSDTVPTFTQVTAICQGETISALPTTSNNGITGTWSPTLNNTATTEYTFIPDAGQCATTQTMIITVNAATTPIFTQVQDICEGESLAALPTNSNNGIEGSWSPAPDNTATTEYTFIPDAGQCATTQTMIITVNAATTPIFTQVQDICEGESLAALPTNSNNGIEGSWSPAPDNTATTTYTFTPNANQCATTQTMTITVNPADILPTFTQVAAICEGESLEALPTTSNNGITGIWSPAPDNTTTTEYTFTPDAGQCATNQTMTITVNPSITPIFSQVEPICFGETLTSLPTTSNNGITGTWSPTLNNTATTEYTFTPSTGLCAIIQTITIVVNSNAAPVISEVVTNGFNIEIFTTQMGDFSYSIDGQNFQYSNIFYGIPGGVYTITVRDNFGCGEDVITHLHFVIPKFFTPNNDGFNDFFEIRGIQELGNSEVNIFDRYGKLLKSYKNSSVVWDGTYLGNLLPTNDYWYQIIFDGEEFTGHFTLKR